MLSSPLVEVDVAVGVEAPAEEVTLRARLWKAFVRAETGPVGIEACQDMCLIDCMVDGVSAEQGPLTCRL